MFPRDRVFRFGRGIDPRLKVVAFNAGHEAGADAGSGELLAEAEALQNAFYDLDGPQSEFRALLLLLASLDTRH